MYRTSVFFQSRSWLWDWSLSCCARKHDGESCNVNPVQFCRNASHTSAFNRSWQRHSRANVSEFKRTFATLTYTSMTWLKAPPVNVFLVVKKSECFSDRDQFESKSSCLLFQYSENRLIKSWVVLLLIVIMFQRSSLLMITGYCSHSINVITFGRVQSDYIKRLLLYYEVYQGLKW